MVMEPPPGPLTPLSPAEVSTAAAAARAHAAGLGSASVRFNTVTLDEPPKKELLAYLSHRGPRPKRVALCVLQTPPGLVDVIEARVVIRDDGSAGVDSWQVFSVAELGGQPLATPDECLEAERLVRADPGVRQILIDRGIDPETLYLDRACPERPLGAEVGPSPCVCTTANATTCTC